VQPAESDADGLSNPSRRNSVRTNMKVERDRAIEIETLKLDIRLKDADSRYLQDLLHKKDDMLQQLTKGLSEVYICLIMSSYSCSMIMIFS
jgi:hypothetical protein